MLYFSLILLSRHFDDWWAYEGFDYFVTVFVLDYFGFYMFNKLRIVYIWLTINAKPLADTLNSVLVT
jgi:hypothetical protein